MYRFVHPEFYTLEKEAVFKKSWIAVGRIDQVQQPGQYFAGNFQATLFEMDIIQVREPTYLSGQSNSDTIFEFERMCGRRTFRSGEGRRPQIAGFLQCV